MCRFPWIVVGISDSGYGFQMSTSFCGAVVFKLKRTVGACYYIDNISCLAANSVSNLKVVVCTFGDVLNVWFDI